MPSNQATATRLPGESYAEFSARQKNAARNEYAKFIAGLSPAEAARLKKVGLDQFEDDNDHVGAPCASEADDDHGAHDDPAEWDRLQETPDMAALIDTLADRIVEAFHVPPSVAKEMVPMMEQWVKEEVERCKAQQLHTIAAFMIAPGNVRVRAYGLAFAAGLDALNGLRSQQEAADLIRVSRSSINHASNQWRDMLDLPTNGHMKSEGARESYRADKLNNHWRNKKFTRAEKQ